MKYLKRLFDFYINSSIHVALAVYAFTWVTLLQFDLSYDESSLYFVFYATIVAYNFVKYFGLVKFHHRQFTTSLRRIQMLSIVAFFASCYYALQLNHSTRLLLLCIGLITFFYAIPLIPKRLLFDEHRNLREISGIKVYVIALVWALTTVILPILHNSIDFNKDVVVVFLQRSLYVIVLMLPFEIRDLKYDSLKLATIPQKIGIKYTKLIGVVLLVLVIICELVKTDVSKTAVQITLIQSGLTLLLLVFSHKDQSKYFSAFWVEGLPMLWLLLLLLFG